MCVFCRFNTLFRSSSFFRKLSSLEVHPCEVPIVVLVSCLSIAMGASVGPEAALGWMGCALAQCFMTTVDHGAAYLQISGGPSQDKSEPALHAAVAANSSAVVAGGGGPTSAGIYSTLSQQQQRLESSSIAERLPGKRKGRSLEQTILRLNARTLALDTIASGLGALFPTPLLSVVLVQELALASGLDFLTSSAYIERCATSLLGTTLCWVRACLQHRSALATNMYISIEEQ